MSDKSESRFEKLATEIITPIMQKVYEVAFECLETYKGDSDKPLIVPFAVKDGVLEGLDEVISYCEDRAGYYESASIIGFALGKDGMKPARQMESMAEVATALRDLIKAKNDQIKAELEGVQEHAKRERMAKAMGF
jgi:hypothetical protein